jgi:hypothetical protein
MFFGSLLLKHCGHFASWNQPLNMCIRVCYLNCYETRLYCYLVIHIENLLHQLHLFYFHLWPIYWPSLVDKKTWNSCNRTNIGQLLLLLKLHFYFILFRCVVLVYQVLLGYVYFHAVYVYFNFYMFFFYLNIVFIVRACVQEECWEGLCKYCLMKARNSDRDMS